MSKGREDKKEGPKDRGRSSSLQLAERPYDPNEFKSYDMSERQHVCISIPPRARRESIETVYTCGEETPSRLLQLNHVIYASVVGDPRVNDEDA
jgi:hypothetical protein